MEQVIEEVKNNLYEWVAITISILSLIFSMLFTLRANRIANNANELSKDSNRIANNANKLAENIGFSEYYNYLDKIKRNILKIEENLIEYQNLKKTMSLINRLTDDIGEQKINNPTYPVPIGANKVIGEIYDECMKIRGKIYFLTVLVVSFNDKCDDEDSNDEYLVFYDTDKIDLKTDGEYNEIVKETESDISKLIKYINSLIELSTNK